MYVEINEPVNKDLWHMGPLTINAYYSPTANKFVLPVGILQYPFFDPNASMESNLGAIGAVIAHELGHGIDDQGSSYDSEGKLRQWFSADDKKNFDARTASLIAQMDAAKHNGSLVLGETIGDFVGLSTAYQAAFPKSQGSITSKQDFFFSWAHAWCQKSTPGFAELQKKTDPHPLGEARVNEQVKQQPGFAEAFSCQAGDPMNLKQRVIIW